MKLYLIPGVGADHRLFKHFKIDGVEMIPLDWEPFGETRSLPDYAEIMSRKIDTSQPFALLGVSMGGMIAVEISKKLRPVRTILVSSSKTHKEFPLHLRFLSKARLSYLAWGGLVKWLSLKAKRRLGLDNREAHEELRQMTREVPSEHLRKSVLAIMNWRNQQVPPGVYHIHGTNDKTLPHKYSNADVLIEEGTHLMIFDNASEVAREVEKVLRN